MEPSVAILFQIMAYMIRIGAKLTPGTEFTSEQGLFLCLEKGKGIKYSNLCRLFKNK